MSNEERFQHFANLALNALAEASACRGMDRKGHMNIAMIYGEMASRRPRPKPTAVITTVSIANGNGATNGAAASH